MLSGVSVERHISEMSAAPASESSEVIEGRRQDEISVGSCVSKCGVGVTPSPALSGISVQTFVR